MTIFYGIPAEWKKPQRRAMCPHCKSEQWTKDGHMPAKHDRPDGRECEDVDICGSMWLPTELGG